MKKNEMSLEEKLTEMTEAKKEADIMLLNLEILVSILGCLLLIIFIMIASFVEMETESRVVLMVFGFILFIFSMHCALVIEQKAGYYECEECHNKYIPSYKKLTLAPHIGRTRYMKCPRCGKKSWNKKVLSK